MDIHKETCRRVDSGYELGVLWKANRPPLSDNYETTLKFLAQSWPKVMMSHTSVC